MAATQPITYTPQFQPPSWQDNVDLVAAAGPNGFNVQFQSLRAELDVLSAIVAQLSTTIITLSQTLNSTQLTANNALQNANTANSTANTANSTANTANSTANTANSTSTNALNTANAAKATADAAMQTANTWQPAITFNVHNQGGYVAWCNVDYNDLFGQPHHLDGGHFPIGRGCSLQTSAGATNVHIACGADGGTTILDVTLPNPSVQNTTKNIHLYGTTLIHSYDGI